jgi:hypothetical protein
VRFLDLGPLNDPGLVPSALASALGLPVQSSDPISSLINFLRDRITSGWLFSVMPQGRMTHAKHAKQ